MSSLVCPSEFECQQRNFELVALFNLQHWFIFISILHIQSLVESGTNVQNCDLQLTLEQNLIYSVVWSFGGFLSQQNKIRFDKWWRDTFHKANSSLCFPEQGLVWDYYTQPGTQGFLAWKGDTLKRSPDSSDNSPAFVPNSRTTAVQHLVNQLIGRGISVFLTGPQGSGKTSLLENLLNSYCNHSRTSDTSLLHIYTNHFTSAKVVWKQMLDCLEWHWGRRYTPKGSKKLVCFVDDLHNTEVCLATSIVCNEYPWHNFRMTGSAR